MITAATPDEVLGLFESFGECFNFFIARLAVAGFDPRIASGLEPSSAGQSRLSERLFAAKLF